MSGWVVSVKVEDADLSRPGGELLYGPFRYRTRALEVAARIGRESGLNLNTHGGWSGTDGDDLFAFVAVRPLQPTTTIQIRDAIASVRNWFTPTEEESK